MDELGITEAFQEFPDQTAWAQELLIKQWDKHWGAK
jgi:hypothetical protein